MNPRHFRLFIAVILLTSVPISVFTQQKIFEKVPPPPGGFGGFGGITQDKSGFIWLGSTYGLLRYDGNKYTVYRHNSSDPNSLTINRSELVYADREGFIWIAAWEPYGCDRLDPATGRFTHFLHNPKDTSSLADNRVRALLEDSEGNMWIGTHGGLDRFDPRSLKFVHYKNNPLDPTSLSSNIVRSLYEDRDHTIWVGTGSVWYGEGGPDDGDGGLNRLDRKSGHFTRYMHDPDNPNSIINNKVGALFEDSKGNFWIGTAGDGLHIMDRASGKFERLKYDPHYPEKLSRPALEPVAGGSDYITFIKEDDLGNIWIGTVGNGVNMYDQKTQKTIHFSGSNPADGPEGRCFAGLKTTDGIFWIATDIGNLYNVNTSRGKIPHIRTGANTFVLREWSDSVLWIGTDSGLFQLDKRTGKTVHKSFSGLNPVVQSMFKDKNDTFWFATSAGLKHFTISKKGTEIEPGKLGNVDNLFAQSFVNVVDGNGVDSLWFGTDAGLVLIKTKNGTDTTHFYQNFSDTNGIAIDRVTAIKQDKEGSLWLGSAFSLGLEFMKAGGKRFQHFLRSSIIFSIFIDSKGILWVGTEEGLYKRNGPSFAFEKINVPENFSDVKIWSISEDDYKNLWLSTSVGIVRFNESKNQSVIFGENYNVDPDELFFCNSFKDQAGKIYFGGNSGYYIVNPKQLAGITTILPGIVFTDFRIGGKSIFDSVSNKLAAEFKKENPLSLKYDQNAIEIDFATINYGSSKGAHTLYNLQNYEQIWHDAGQERFANYYNLPPGQYVFRLKTSSGEGAWVEKDIKIVISPPFWRTWWAYTIYAILLLAVIYFFHRIQRQRVIQIERNRTRERELQQAKEIEKAYHELRNTQATLVQQEKMASLGELTAGIAHEIQNPLNFVNNFSEVNDELLSEVNEQIKQGNLGEVQKILNNISDNEKKIIHHGKRADSIVKNMLQHSRASAGQKELTDINALADEYLRLSYHGFRAKDKTFNVAIKTDFDKNIGQINIIPQDIGRVLLNLFNNAFYAVAEKKKKSGDGYEPVVLVSSKKTDGKVEIRVRDNGGGIPQKVLDKIFQPFFTTKPAGEGTGLGLSLSYDVVKTHGGEIKVDTREGEQTEFTISLPMKVG